MPEDQLFFGWNGGTEVGQAHYYSIQGPTFLLEFANFQNGANHVHASWRDLKKDFGYDPLAEREFDAIEAMMQLMAAEPSRLRFRNAYNVSAMSITPAELAGAIAARVPGFVVDYDVARFFADAEAIYSYEGTHEINALVVGRSITGIGSFK